MKILPIKKSSEFKIISQKGNKFISKSLILLSYNTNEKYKFNPETGKMSQDFCRIGFTVSKKIGNAVTRNKAKRKLREAVRKIFPDFAKKHQDYVIIARSEINNCDFNKILSDLKFCIKRIKISKEE